MKILSRNIDLTEHFDFSGGGSITRIQLVDDVVDRKKFSMLVDMSYDEFEKFKLSEKFFGEYQMYSLGKSAFYPETDGPFVPDYLDPFSDRHKRCYRCGCIIFPWDNDLCNKCKTALEYEHHHMFGTSVFRPTVMQSDTRIFNLR